MRPITTLMIALLATLLMTACSQESTKPPEPAKPAETALPAAVEQAKQVAEEVKQKVEETAAAVKQEAAPQVEAVKEQVTTVTEQAKTAVTETVDKAKETAAAAATAVTAAAKPAAKAPTEVVYQASNGKVTFNHASHAKLVDCSKCHPTEPAVAIAMTKEVGHTLCKGCHQSSGGNAPTACAGCHVK